MDTVLSTWQKLKSCPGDVGPNPSFFTIDGLVYLVGGAAGEPTQLWAYNPLQDTWNRRADFPEEGKKDGTAFVLNGKGYYGLGSVHHIDQFHHSITYPVRTFYAYQPLNNEWLKVAPFPGEARKHAVAITDTGKAGQVAFVGLGCGSTNLLKDFYAYRPATGCWTRIKDYPGEASYDAVAFAFQDQKGISLAIGMGITNTGISHQFYRLQSKGRWSGILSKDNEIKTLAPRAGAFAFTLRGVAYVGGGYDHPLMPCLNDFYRYLPASHSWKPLINHAIPSCDSTGRPVHTYRKWVGCNTGNTAYIRDNASGAFYAYPERGE